MRTLTLTPPTGMMPPSPLHRESSAALQLPEVRERLSRLGAEPMTMTLGEFDAYVRDELRTNAALVKAAGITAN